MKKKIVFREIRGAEREIKEKLWKKEDKTKCDRKKKEIKKILEDMKIRNKNKERRKKWNSETKMMMIEKRRNEKAIFKPTTMWLTQTLTMSLYKRY